MTAKRFIVATAGHVDHGKSALVKALTGTDPDRLPEEKARGITIDLGFAHLGLADEGGALMELGIVDVPGHEDFVKNMVAGVGAVDLALFVVAADDGWMPQSEEHLQILAYLGVTRGVVALTKADLLEGDSTEAQARIREHLRGSPFSEAPIVATSAKHGTGLEALKREMAGLLRNAPPPADAGKPRLPVDRVFTLRGIGTVVTGTLIGGALSRGQAVVVQPGGRESRVRGLQNHHSDVETSGPGTRTAVNLADVGVAGRGRMATDAGVSRGQVVTVAALGGAHPTADALVFKSARLADQAGGAARPLKDGMRLRVHCGAANWPARLFLLSEKEVSAGGQAVGQLRFDQPVFVLAGDRFVVRDWAEQFTLGGGVILDAEANRRRFRGVAQRTFLKGRADAPADVAAYVRTELFRVGAARRSTLLGRTVFGRVEIDGAVESLQRAGAVAVAGEWVAHAAWWKEVCHTAERAVGAEHERHPERAGLALNDLRGALRGRLSDDSVFDAILETLCRSGYKRAGAFVARADHRPALPAALQASGTRIRSALKARPFEPPSRKELAPDTNSQQALRFLRETGEVMELSAEVVILADAFAKMRGVVVSFICARGRATVSELRQQLGTTRRIMMPLLDRLDRDGVTLRQGDQRVLGRNAGVDGQVRAGG